MSEAYHPKLESVRWRPKPIATERLLLRGYEPSDCGQVFAYASDPDVTVYMAWNRHKTLADTQNFLDTFAAMNYRARELDFAICERERPDRAIGGMGLYWRSRTHGVMELGYVLDKAYWGRGYVPEAGRSLMQFAFATLEVHRIYAPVLAENEKSRKAAVKMGMNLDGVLRSSLMLRGRRWDEAVYSMLRDEIQTQSGLLHERDERS